MKQLSCHVPLRHSYVLLRWNQCIAVMWTNHKLFSGLVQIVKQFRHLLSMVIVAIQANSRANVLARPPKRTREHFDSRADVHKLLVQQLKNY